MEPGTALGSTGLAISVVTNGQRVLEFLIDWVKSSKQYGEDVRVIHTRLTAESARLQAFVAFLKEQLASGISRYSELSEISQRAISGMVQELELAFDSYMTLVNKYKIEDLQRGYEAHMAIVGQVTTSKTAARIKAAGKEESEAKQKAASHISVSAWGLFRKQKVLELVSTVESWNDKLQNFLLCGLCFGKGPRIVEVLNQPILEKLRVNSGLKLRSLILEDSRATHDHFKTGWILDKAGNELDPRIQRLTVVGGHQGPASHSDLVFVEYKEFKLRRHMSGPSDVVLEGVASLAKLLSQPRAPESGFRTLQCTGVVRQTSPRQRFGFVFQLPHVHTLEDPGITSIASAIAPKFEHRPTLGEKFRMARSLAESLYQFHSVDWLHKSIRSENILLFCEDSPRPDFRKPFLVGFEFSRAEKDISTTDQDDSLARNIYRHPDKQGPPEERFNVLHDIYAFGVVLLEIGIWRPLLGFDKGFDKMKPEEVKTCLEAHAKERLPHYMGVDYTEAVMSCLQGVLLNSTTIESSSNFGEQGRKEQIQAAFWKKVVDKIERGTQLR